MLETDVLAALDAGMVERYSTRLRQFGADPRTLGWDKRESQVTRFAAATRALSFAGRSILDIGCGLADFNEFLRRDPATTPSGYAGIDINPDLIEVCRQRFADSAFEVRNVLREPVMDRRWDIVTMFGLLNLRFSEFTNESYARDFIASAYGICNEALVVDMLSARIDEAYPPENFVYYYRPGEMLDFALSLTPHVTMLHDYRSIPQREFMLVMRRSECA